MFDHQQSDRVDVHRHPHGEFVQIWDTPRTAANRRILLTYIRTPTGPREIGHCIDLDEGPFERIEITDLRRDFYYRDGGPPRREQFLPSGRLLIHDPRNSFAMRSVMTEGFDWDKRVPIGKPFGDRKSLRFQKEGLLWYCCTYQDSASEADALRLVEEYRGRELVRAVEFDPS